MKNQLFVIGVTLIGGVSGPAAGHEFWIEPSTFHPEAGALVRVGLRVGERFRGEPVGRHPASIEKFVTVGPGKESAVVGRSGAETSFARVEGSGLHWIAYRSRRSFHRMEAKAFEDYLKEEGLGYILPLRAKLGEEDRPGLEAYSRCAKALISVGASSTKGHDRLLGLPLELVPLANPYGLGAGEGLGIQLLYEGKALEGFEVVAVHRASPEEKIVARTDGKGVARFDVDRSGEWLMTAIHMVRAPEGVDADWESFWASLTFEIRGRGTAGR